MKNCMEFIIAEQGVYCLGGSTAALYDTFGPAAAQFILGETGSKSVVTTRSQLPRLCEAKKSGECPTFQHVIVVDGVTPAAAQMAAEASLEVISFAKVEAVGAQVIATEGDHKHNPPSPKDIATFCYTSGTTGNPKGAMLTHENLVSCMAGIPSLMIPEMSDRHLSYMPLAHIFERVVLNNMFVYGASIGFWRGDPLLLIEDIQACRPTMLAAVPRVLNKIYEKVSTGINAAGGMKKKIFDAFNSMINVMDLKLNVAISILFDDADFTRYIEDKVLAMNKAKDNEKDEEEQEDEGINFHTNREIEMVYAAMSLGTIE